MYRPSVRYRGHLLLLVIVLGVTVVRSGSYFAITCYPKMIGRLQIRHVFLDWELRIVSGWPVQSCYLSDKIYIVSFNDTALFVLSIVALNT